MKCLAAILKRLELTLHPEKTKLVNLWDGKEGFDFLGLHHRKRRNPGKPIPILESWPSKKAVKAIREKVREITAPRARPKEPVQKLIEALNRKIQGWANYYGIGHSHRQFAQLDWYICQRLTLFMNKKTCRRRKSKSRKFTPDYFANSAPLYPARAHD
ncbi:MAG: group II intron maturase-specific domain-containing protein [Chitinophagales bacterium]